MSTILCSLSIWPRLGTPWTRSSYARKTLLLAVTAASIFRPLQAQQPLRVSSRQQTKALVIRIHPDGFDPPAATITDQKIMLIVENFDGLRSQDYSLQRLDSTGQSLGDLRREQVKENSKRWFAALEVTPGQYKLVENGGKKKREFVLTVK